MNLLYLPIMRKKLTQKVIIILSALLPVLALQSCGPKYVFLVIGDGMGINTVYGTELYNAALQGDTAPKPLTFTSFPYRSFLSTYALNSLVTDSSAAGTALASGTKINASGMGMTPDGVPVSTIASEASACGYGTGVVTTVAVNHATPAAFYAATPNRHDYKDITTQLIEGTIDFAAGADFITRDTGFAPADWEIAAVRKGWNVSRGAVGLEQASNSDKVLYLAREDSRNNYLPYAMENNGVHLPEITAAAIKSLEKYHRKGFFLMVEGGNIDHCAHENDAVCTFREVNEMDAAVDVIMEFYRRHPRRTLVVVTSDHDTGSMTIGDNSYVVRPSALIHQKVTKGYLTKEFRRMRASGNPSWAEAKQLLEEGLGLWKYVAVKPAEEAALKDVFDRTIVGNEDPDDPSWYACNEKMARAAIDLLQQKARMDFTVTSHSAAQVPLYAIGCGAEKVALAHDETDVANIIRALAGYKK